MLILTTFLSLYREIYFARLFQKFNYKIIDRLVSELNAKTNLTLCCKLLWPQNQKETNIMTRKANLMG